MKLVLVLVVSLFTSTLFAHNGDGIPHLSGETERFGIQYIGNASVGLTNRTIQLEIQNNSIEWVKPGTGGKNFAEFINQGMAFLHV